MLTLIKKCPQFIVYIVFVVLSLFMTYTNFNKKNNMHSKKSTLLMINLISQIVMSLLLLWLCSVEHHKTSWVFVVISISVGGLLLVLTLLASHFSEKGSLQIGNYTIKGKLDISTDDANIKVNEAGLNVTMNADDDDKDAQGAKDDNDEKEAPKLPVVQQGAPQVVKEAPKLPAVHQQAKASSLEQYYGSLL